MNCQKTKFNKKGKRCRKIIYTSNETTMSKRHLAKNRKKSEMFPNNRHRPLHTEIEI